jgi:hypothetical protein
MKFNVQDQLDQSTFNDQRMLDLIDNQGQNKENNFCTILVVQANYVVLTRVPDKIWLEWIIIIDVLTSTSGFEIRAAIIQEYASVVTIARNIV